MIFQSARIKLTAWYVAIIMIISICFSGLVYRNVMSEVNRGLRMRAIRTPFYIESFLVDDQLLYEEIRNRIVFQLFFVNACIFAGSSLAGYFLAGKTLRPIEQMVLAQNHFIADASHELRTPLTSMKTEIEVSLRDKKLSLKESRKLIESNLEEVNKMQTLSNYLLSLQRYQNGDAELPKKEVYLNKVVQRVVDKLIPLANKKGVTLQTDLAVTTAVVNETSIEELVSILVDNAIKYSQEKGNITVSVAAKKGTVYLKVRDEGIGIKASDIPYIFNRFYRADTSRTKQKVDGYGLGLSIAKSVVTLHRGRIEVESTLGKGTTFVVTIPRF